MSSELIRELVEALDDSNAVLDDLQFRYGETDELQHYDKALIAKARAYLETGGWTKVEDGLPRHDRRNEPPLRIWVSMNGETPWKYLYVQGDDPSGQFTHWRYAESTPESPKG